MLGLTNLNVPAASEDKQRSPMTPKGGGEDTGSALGDEEILDFYDDESGWTNRAWASFAKVARQGALTTEEFILWAQEMNVECDPTLVHQAVPKDRWNRITFEVALKALEVIPTLALTLEKEGETGASGRREEEEKGDDVVRLGLFRYLWTVVFCGKKDPSKQYVLSVEFNISPRFWLVFNASLVFLLVSAAILGLMGALWIQNSESRESTILRQLEETIQFIVNSMSENTLAVSGRDLLDQAVTLSRFLEQLKALELEEVLARMRSEHSTDTMLTIRRLEEQKRLNVLEMNGRMQALATLAGTNMLGASVLVRLTSGWLDRAPGWAAVIYNLRTDTVHWTNQYVPPADRETFLARVGNSVCVRELRERRSGETHFTLGLEGTPNATMIYQYYPHEGMGLCMSIGTTEMSQLLRQYVVRNVDDLNRETFQEIGTTGVTGQYLPDVTVAGMYQPQESNSTSTRLKPRQFRMLSTPSFKQQICGLPSNQQRCANFLAALEECYGEQCSNKVREDLFYYNGVPTLVAMSYIATADIVLSHAIDAEMVSDHFSNRVIRLLNKMNERLTESTLELAIAARDTSSGRLVAQVTDYKFAGDCYGECARIPESVAAIFNTFATGGSGYAYYPDYRPAPIVGGFCHLLNNINQTFIVERDVTELRTANLELLVAAVDKINEQMEDSTEIMVFREEGVPVAQTFDPYEPCPSNVICDIHPTLGMLARSDCQDCLRQEKTTSEITTATSPTIYSTKVRFPERCVGCDVSNPKVPGADHRITQNAIAAVNKEETELEDLDYGKTMVKYYFSFVETMSTFLLVKRDLQEIREQSINNILVGVGIAAGLVFLGVITLIVLSRRVLNRIELEWAKYNRAIEREKQKFDSMVEEAIPSAVLTRYRRGQRNVVETLPSVCYACIDVCGFTENMKDANPKEPVRLTAYYSLLFYTAGRVYKLFRLKSYGDVTVYCAGINNRSQAKGTVVAAQDAYGTAGFAASVLQLLSGIFAHFPWKLRTFVDMYKGEPEQPLRILPVRIGLHCGPISAGVVDVGTTPLYEHYGSALALTHRLQATCQPGKAHASSVFKDLVESVDAANSFEFDTLRKTMIKGRGTITSYPIRSAQIVLEVGILKRLQIEYATAMYQFMNKTGQKGAAGATEGSRSEEKRSSSHVSSGSRDHSSATGSSSASSIHSSDAEGRSPAAASL